MTTTQTDGPARIAPSRLALAGTLALVVASAVNVLLGGLATSLLGVSAGYGPLGWGPVVNTTVAATIGATVVYGLLDRVTERPNRAFLGVAGFALLVSFAPLVAPPAFLADAPTPVLVTLAAMHVTTALVVVVVLVRAGAQGRRP